MIRELLKESQQQSSWANQNDVRAIVVTGQSLQRLLNFDALAPYRTSQAFVFFTTPVRQANQERQHIDASLAAGAIARASVAVAAARALDAAILPRQASFTVALREIIGVDPALSPCCAVALSCGTHIPPDRGVH